MIHLGLNPPKTHYLNELIQIIMKSLPVPDNVRVCVRLNNYAVTTRYPDDYYEITEDEYNTAVEISEDVFNWVVETIK
ncbi:MAG: HEPN domain-containing protein [Spirochaetaceae bacterium]